MHGDVIELRERLEANLARLSASTRLTFLRSCPPSLRPLLVPELSLSSSSPEGVDLILKTRPDVSAADAELLESAIVSAGIL